jgi:hypothetical protein
MATIPPLRSEASAARTTSPLGAKVTAQSRGTGGTIGGVANPYRAERAGQLLVRRAAGRDVDLAIPGFENFDGEMRGGSKAEEADAIAGRDFGHAQAAESDDAGAEQRGEVHGLVLFRERNEEIGARCRVFGIAAVDGVAREGGVVAEILAALAAEEAGSVGATEPGDAGPRAWFPAGTSLPKLLDAPDDLVARGDGSVQRRQFSGGDVQVGAADAAGFDAEQDFAGAWLGNGQVLHRQRARGDGSRLMEDGGAHWSLE